MPKNVFKTRQTDDNERDNNVSEVLLGTGLIALVFCLFFTYAGHNLIKYLLNNFIL